jgi:hypothetical protein
MELKLLPKFVELLRRVVPLKSKGEAALPFILSKNPFAKIITVKAGKYKVSRGALPVKIKLHRNFRLMPLTKGLLKQFAGNEVVDRILERRENVQKEDGAMITDISILDSLDLLEVMNPRFKMNGVRLRIPTEAVIDVFVSSRWNRAEKKRLSHILTSSPYEKLVDTKVLERDFSRENVDENDIFVARSANNLKYRGEIPVVNHNRLNMLLIEVVVRTTDPREPTLA